MPRPKKSDEVTSVGIRLTQDELDTIDTFWRLNLYKDRSDLLKSALELRLSGVKCPKCGAINPKGAHLCAVCLRPFDEKNTIFDVIRLFVENKEIIDKFEKNEWD